MKPPVIKTSLGFANGMPDNTLITFSRNVHSLLYGIAGFTNIPVTAIALLATIDAFAEAKAAQPHGGKAATALKDERRQELIVMLKTLALYVQEQSDNNLALLLSTGFEAISTNRARYPLSKPSILKITGGMTGESLVTLSTESISRGCELRVAEIDAENKPGEFRVLPFSTSSRNIPVTALVPGRLYAFQGRNVGGSTTYSDWSDVVVQRAA
jgi:hypothetical protein